MIAFFQHATAVPNGLFFAIPLLWASTLFWTYDRGWKRAAKDLLGWAEAADEET